MGNVSLAIVCVLYIAFMFYVVREAEKKRKNVVLKNLSLDDPKLDEELLRNKVLFNGLVSFYTKQMMKGSVIYSPPTGL
jgi:hypothetical protein